MVSDENINNIEDTQDSPDAERVASPGKLLREGREKQGLSQQQVAEKLFLKVSQIDDLENDRIDDKTSITFTRGYIRNYAKQLGLSQDVVIAEFDKLHTAPKQPARLQSFSKRVAKQTHDDRWMMVTYVILLMLIAGVVVWWYQQSNNQALPGTTSELTETQDVSSGEFSDDTQSAPPVTAEASDAVDATAESQMQQPSTDSVPDSSEGDDAVDDAATLSEDTSEPENGGVFTSTASVDVPATTTDSQTESLQTESLQTAESVQTEPIAMVFTFSDDCWVNIEDGTGEAIAYGIKQAGRVMEISGIPPVEVTLGAPDNVAITVNGEAVDMSVYQTGRTARFSLPIQD
ncbi:RodZ domain-containing protein [Alteromonas sp. CYL-A6]|uniref:RodZ domain-containing protein n=1 Tax=Alteromonas nitratireducens TaxID=3390813 RepID=UPI0034B79B4F